MVDIEFLIITVANSVVSFVMDTVRRLRSEELENIEQTLDTYFRIIELKDNDIIKYLSGILFVLYSEICKRYQFVLQPLAKEQKQEIAFGVAIGFEKAKRELYDIWNVEEPKQLTRVETQNAEAILKLISEVAPGYEKEKEQELFDLWTVYNLYLARKLSCEVAYPDFFTAYKSLPL